MVSQRISSLTELRRFLKPDSLPPWHMHIVQREMNGGRTSIADLEQIGPQVTALTISGLDQDAFEALVRRAGAQLTALHLWKCPRLSDLSPMEDMPELTHAAVFWNQRTEKLWNMRRTPKLEALYFKDFVKLTKLDDLRSAVLSLCELEFGDANFSRFVLQSLDPVGDLPQLKRLSFNAKSIVDRRVQPLARLRRLRELDIAPALFTVEQLAWLRVRLPATVTSAALAPFSRLTQPVRRGAKALDVLVNGKGMPFLSSTVDAKRLENCVRTFGEFVRHYEQNPQDEPANSEA